MSKQLLEYVIIYTSDGIPIYSRCFGNICNRSFKDDVLLSGFLSALRQFAKVGGKDTIKEVDFDGQKVQVHFDDENEVHSLEFKEMDLLFHYLDNDEVTIAVGGSTGSDIEERPEIMQELLFDLETFMGNWDSVNWSNVSSHTLDDFEKHLLGQIIHPFLDKYDIPESCAMGKNCPFRKAMYDGEGKTIYEKIDNYFTDLANGSMLKAMWLMISGRFSKMFERRNTITT